MNIFKAAATATGGGFLEHILRIASSEICPECGKSCPGNDRVFARVTREPRDDGGAV